MFRVQELRGGGFFVSLEEARGVLGGVVVASNFQLHLSKSVSRFAEERERERVLLSSTGLSSSAKEEKEEEDHRRRRSVSS